MEDTSMRELLQADEDALRKTLRANRSVDKSREAVAETLREELGTMLLPTTPPARMTARGRPSPTG